MTISHTKRTVIGLSSKNTTGRCNRCDLPLSTSLWKSHLVYFVANTRHRPTRICVRCVVHPRNEGKQFYQSPKQLDNFVRRLILV